MSCLQTTAQIADLDAKIHSLEAQLLDLRRKRNRLMPIAKLPPELINDILRHLVDATVSDSEKVISDALYKENRLLVYRWLPVTHFCSQWRKLALENSSLWTHIWTTDLGRFKAFIERSKDQLLHIDTWSDGLASADQEEVFQLIVSNMHRIRLLRLRLWFTRNKVPMLQNIPAPQLEVLIYSDTSYNPITTPPTQLEYPKLRRLEIHTCSEDEWGCLLPSRLPTVTDVVLKELKLHDQIALLNRCTSIRHLSIIDYMLDSSDPPAPVELPNLQYLKHSFAPWNTLDFLAFPSVSRVDIDTNKTTNHSDEAGASISVLSRFLGLFRDPIHSDAPPHHFSLIFDTHNLTVKASGPTGEQLISFNSSSLWQSPVDASDYTQWFEGLLQLSKTTNIGFESIEVRSKLGVHDIFCAFQEHASVSKIHINSTDGFMDILSPTYMSTVECIVRVLDMPLTKPFCECQRCHEMRITSYPGLKTLVLDTVEEEAVPYKDAEWLEMFLGWLTERSARGIGLENLVLHSIRGKVVQEELEKLRSIVPRVELEEHEEPQKELV